MTGVMISRMIFRLSSIAFNYGSDHSSFLGSDNTTINKEAPLYKEIGSTSEFIPMIRVKFAAVAAIIN